MDTARLIYWEPTCLGSNAAAEEIERTSVASDGIRFARANSVGEGAKGRRTAALTARRIGLHDEAVVVTLGDLVSKGRARGVNAGVESGGNGPSNSRRRARARSRRFLVKSVALDHQITLGDGRRG